MSIDVDRLDEQDLDLAIQAAFYVLADDLNDNDERDRLSHLPRDSAKAELTTLLSEAGAPDADQLAGMLTDEANQDFVAKGLVKAVLTDPEVSKEVEDALTNRKSMMVIDGGIITGPVLVAILLLRIKKLRIGKQGVEAEFADSKALGPFFGLLGRGGGGG